MEGIENKRTLERDSEQLAEESMCKTKRIDQTKRTHTHPPIHIYRKGLNKRPCLRPLPTNPRQALSRCTLYLCDGLHSSPLQSPTLQPRVDTKNGGRDDDDDDGDGGDLHKFIPCSLIISAARGRINKASGGCVRHSERESERERSNQFKREKAPRNGGAVVAQQIQNALPFPRTVAARGV